MKRERMLMWIYFGGRGGLSHFYQITSPCFISKFFFFLRAEKWWTWGEKNQVPLFSLHQNHSNQTPLPPKISPIFSSPFSILPIFMATKRSLGLRLIAFFFFWVANLKAWFFEVQIRGIRKWPQKNYNGM